MASFFEKLKKGMGVEEEPEPIEEPIKEKKVKPVKVKKAKKIEIKTAPIEEEPEIKEEDKEPSSDKALEEEEEKLLEPEGQLAIDVYQTENELVIQSAIAGVRSDNLEISLEKDILTIRGSREKPYRENGDYFSQECYWGPFSREIILPVEIDPNRVGAEMKSGILTIRIPKILREKKRKIMVRVV